VFTGVATLSVAHGASHCNRIAELAKLIVGAVLAKVNDPINLCFLIQSTDSAF
jgi:hypothetical protein